MDKSQKLNGFLIQYRQILNDHINSFTIKFNSYRESVNQVYKDNIDVIDQQFELLARPYRIILKEKDELNEQNAWDFTIFEIIKSKRPEEHIHSPLLLELLNTEGKHGQKDLFYKLFLKTLLHENQIQKYVNDDHSEYKIKEEEGVKSEAGKGRIDISIKSTNPKKKFAIIIENKWNSPDSCVDQLYKYYKGFIENEYNDENLLLVYLTIHGGDPDPRKVESPEFKNLIANNKNRNYFPISYQEHISQWLTICSVQCKSDKVKQLIIQYLNFIKWNQSSMIKSLNFQQRKKTLN